MTATRTRPSHTPLLALFALCLSAVAVSARQAAPATPAAPPAAADQKDEAAPAPLFGQVLVVNDHTISEAEIKRHLVYGVGKDLIEMKKLDMILDQELRFRKNQGEDISAYAVDEADVAERFDAQVSQFKERYPTLDLATEVRRAYKDANWYRMNLRQTAKFDKIFFPGHPDNWSDLTKEALAAGSPEVDLLKDAGESWERRHKHAEETGEPVPAEDDFYMSILRDMVMQFLISDITTRAASDGIPTHLALEVYSGGMPLGVVTVDEIFALIEPALTPHMIEEARLFSAILHVTEAQMRADGILMSGEDFTALFQEQETATAGSMFNMNMIALTAHGFPSMSSYKDYYRLSESHRLWMEVEVQAPEGQALHPAVKEHMSVANLSMGLAKADTEVLLVSAFDFPNYKWKEDGWAKASKRANELMAEIQSHADFLAEVSRMRKEAAQKGENFDDPGLPSRAEHWAGMLDLHSEYWDPPMPASGKSPSMVGLKMKGRFTPKTRNDLEKALDGSGYQQFVYGRSLTNTIFQDMKPGEIGGPFE
ncbi:MAG: hypothetical protein QF615_14755, partial [Planctomycetota bacterium]|nr:hypothetical protein [Planctomycetota bacterium]